MDCIRKCWRSPSLRNLFFNRLCYAIIFRQTRKGDKQHHKRRSRKKQQHNTCFTSARLCIPGIDAAAVKRTDVAAATGIDASATVLDSVFHGKSRPLIALTAKSHVLRRINTVYIDETLLRTSCNTLMQPISPTRRSSLFSKPPTLTVVTSSPANLESTGTVFSW